MSRKEVIGLGGIASLAMAGRQQLTFCELEAFGEPRALEDSPLTVSQSFPPSPDSNEISPFFPSWSRLMDEAPRWSFQTLQSLP